MGLFDEINKKATIANVREFFDDEDNYPTIRRRSGDWGIKSPQMDITGVPGSGAGNLAEIKAVQFTVYKQAVAAVNYAINGCCDRSKKILQLRYVQGLRNYQVRERIHLYGHSSYRRADDYACLEFADTIEAACVIYTVDRKIVPVMHVKIKRDENGTLTGH